MRFALMIEPQQGLTYEEQLAVARRGRGGRLRDALPVRPLRELSRRDRRADDRRLGRPRRPRPRDDARSGSGALVSPVTFRHARQPSPRSRSTVDEMSGGRVEVGVGAGWHEAEHRRHGFPFPAIGERADDARGDARDPPRPVGRARRLVVHRRALRDRRRAVPPEAGSLPARNGGRPPIIVGARGRRARCGSRLATPTSSTSRPRARRSPTQKYAALDATPARRGPRPVVDHPLRDGRRADRAGRRRGPRPGAATC